jgi:hypothetical protein
MASLGKARVVVEPTGAVRVHVSGEVLYNLEATLKLTKEILGRLGCGTCHSGRQILFQQDAVEFSVGA